MDELNKMLDKELDSFLTGMPISRKSVKSISERMLFISENSKIFEMKLKEVYFKFHEENNLEINSEDLKCKLIPYFEEIYFKCKLLNSKQPLFLVAVFLYLCTRDRRSNCM